MSNNKYPSSLVSKKMQIKTMTIQFLKLTKVKKKFSVVMGMGKWGISYPSGRNINWYNFSTK